MSYCNSLKEMKIFTVRCGNLRLFQFQGVAFIKNLGQVEIVHQEVLYKYQNKTSE